MYKVPHHLVGTLRFENPDAELLTLAGRALREVETYGMYGLSVGSLLTVKWGGQYFVTSYYWMNDKREAEMDAARNGFPFITNDNDIPMKVGLLARVYRAIIV